MRWGRHLQPHHPLGSNYPSAFGDILQLFEEEEDESSVANDQIDSSFMEQPIHESTRLPEDSMPLMLEDSSSDDDGSDSEFETGNELSLEEQEAANVDFGSQESLPGFEEDIMTIDPIEQAPTTSSPSAPLDDFSNLNIEEQRPESGPLNYRKRTREETEHSSLHLQLQDTTIVDESQVIPSTSSVTQPFGMNAMFNSPSPVRPNGRGQPNDVEDSSVVMEDTRSTRRTTRQQNNTGHPSLTRQTRSRIQPGAPSLQVGPPTPAVTRSKSRAKVVTSSKPKPSNPSPPIIVIPSDGEIQKNIGWMVSFSREEKQLIYDLNFSLKKMWNLKNLCWMNASLIGLLYTFKENNTMLEEAPPELPRRNWSFKDYLAELQHMQDNTTFDCRLMIKKILLEFSNANVGWEAGNDFVDHRLLEQQQQIETLFQIFGPNTQYDCPWDSLRPKIEWSVDTEVCPNQRCSRKAIGKTAKTRTDALITISSIPDGTDFSDKVSHDFGSVDPDSECAQYTCECGQGCKDEQLQNCPRLYICKETIKREMKGRVVDAKQGVIFSLPRIKYGANFTWVMIKLLLKSD